LQKDLEKVAPGWTMSNCGPDMDPGLRAEFRGKKNVFMTHPLDRQTGCTLIKKVALPADKKTVLRLVVAHDPRGDWTLIVKADGKPFLKQPVNAQTAPGGWAELRVDLGKLAGKEVLLELVNQADGWAFEAGYWAAIELESH